MIIDLHGVRVGWSCGGLASDPVARMLAGFAPAEGGQADLTVTLAPADGFAGREPVAEGALPLFFHNQIRGFLCAGSIVISDRRSRLALSPDSSRIDGEVQGRSLGEDEDGFPTMLFIALMVALRARGLFHAHAAALVAPDGLGLLLAGASGSGKTTTTAALLTSGCSYLGDDAVLLAMRGGNAVALAFPRPFHLSETTLRAFPELEALAVVGSNSQGKRSVDPRLAFPSRALDSVERIDLVCFPRVDDLDRTRVEPMTPADAFGHLLASTALGVVDHVAMVPEQLQVLRSLVDGARAARVLLGRDALRCPADLLAHLRTAL